MDVVVACVSVEKVRRFGGGGARGRPGAEGCGFFLALFRCHFSVWFMGVSFGVPGVDSGVFLEVNTIQHLPKF